MQRGKKSENMNVAIDQMMKNATVTRSQGGHAEFQFDWEMRDQRSALIVNFKGNLCEH